MNSTETSSRQARELAERLAAIEASSAWALARRLSQARRRLAPEGSLRLAGLRLVLRGLRLWRDQGFGSVCRRAVRGFLPSAPQDEHSAAPIPSVSPDPPRGPDRMGPARVPSLRKFRVAFVGPGAGCEAQSMRYRAHNVIEALARVHLEGTFVPREDVAARLPFLLSHDLIVLVRVMDSEAIALLVELAGRAGIPVVFDIDDCLFVPWIIPYVEVFRTLRPADARRIVDLLSRSLHRCDYFTGATAYLAETAATLGKMSFVIRNGLNETQIELTRLARERRAAAPRDGRVRIGYFSGTRTHQADFRVAYPALMALLREEPSARLVVVGDLDLDEFAGLAPFVDRVDRLPLRKWQELPDAIAAIDINLIPLELTPFNEGKSALKYFEAGLCMVPSVASPTRVLRESITHGQNGLLARSGEEWHAALKELVSRPEQRERIGWNAYDHVLRTSTPAVTAAEAATAYRNILRTHRAKRGIPADALSIVVLLPDLQSQKARRDALRRAEELAAAGHGVTVLALDEESFPSAEALKQHLVSSGPEPRFAIQRGGDVPCCDVLLAVDSRTADAARANAARAHVVCPEADLDPLLRELAAPGVDWIDADSRIPLVPTNPSCGLSPG
jgi:glycosyltransferase involved in cell wall biosynthesis